MALAKSALTATLLRLSPSHTSPSTTSSTSTTAPGSPRRRVRVVLWLLLLVAWAFALALAVVTWLDICEQRVDASLSVGGAAGAGCVPFATVIWIHTGNAVATIVVDAALACMPWQVLSRIYIPRREKWGVACSMSLTGCAAVVCIVR